MSCACSEAPRCQLKLTKRIAHNDQTYSFEFSSAEPITWQAGDSSKLYLPMMGHEMGKKFSHANAVGDNTVRFTTRIRPKASLYKQRLDQLQIGDTLEATLPSGHFGLRRDHRPVVLLSNGVGIAAVRPHILAYANDDSAVPQLLQLNVDRSGKLYHSEFEQIANACNGFSSHYSSSRQGFYEQLDYHLQAVIDKHSQSPLIYVVGSDSFVIATMSHLQDRGIQKNDIITDGDRVAGGCGCGEEASCGCGGNLFNEAYFNLENVI